MNKVAILVVMHLVVIENVENNTTVAPSLTEGCFFKEINSNLDNITEQLFINLKLNQNYTETSKIKLLKFIHESLRNISDRNFEIYNDIKYVTSSIIKYDNKTTSALFNLTDIIDEIFNILELESEVTINVVVNEFNNTKAIFKTFGTVVNETGSDSMIDVMKSFIGKKGNKTKRRRRRKKKHKKGFNGASYTFSRNILYNLKPWRPPKNLSELSYIPNRRIYKGKKAKVKRFPFIVSIHIMEDFLCSGSIISRDLVITSASCLQTAYNDKHLIDDPNAITIRAGSEFTRDDGIVVPVVKIYFHPMYDPHYLANNLAIARVKTSVTDGSGVKIRRIEFDKLKAKVPESGQVTILGWGDKDSYSTYSGPLTMAHLEVYGLEPCKEVYSENYVQDTNFCAGFVTVGGGACNKDIGGPGLIDNLLVGIVSFGPPICGTEDAPTVFTKLGFYSEWINSIMKKVLRTPYNKVATATFRVSENNSEVQIQQPVQRSELPEILTLKRLFNHYILSGKMDIKELLPDDNNNGANFLSNRGPVEDDDDYPAPHYNIEQEVNPPRQVDFKKVRNYVEAHITQTTISPLILGNYIHDLSASSDFDGAPKSNSLTDYDSVRPQEVDDDESSEGLSIDMNHNKKSSRIQRSRQHTNVEQVRASFGVVPPTRKIKRYEHKPQKVGLMDAYQPLRSSFTTVAEPNVIELSHNFDINVEKLDIPPALMDMFLRGEDSAVF